MNLTRFALERRTLTHFITALIFLGGIAAYFGLGRLEDPDFTVKVAMVITQYPGASPEEVEQEVTDPIEKAIQELTQLDHMYSISRAGLSLIRVEIKQEYWADRLPQVWDELRSKVGDVAKRLSPGVQTPRVVDDFSFVYGFVLAVTGDGYDYAELEDHAKSLKDDLSLVNGVSRVELWGQQPKVLYLDVSEAQLAALEITREDILATLATQNQVVDAGHIQPGGQRLRIQVSGEFTSPEDIGNLLIRRSILDTAADAARQLAPYGKGLSETRPMGRILGGSAARARGDELIRIRDVATVRLGYLDPPLTQMRYQGQPALALQIANAAGGNIVDTGKALDKRIAELEANLPVGIEVHKFAWQSDLVIESIDGFVVNLAEAVLIVLVVLALAMGWRMGVIIGWALVLTILGTFIVLQILDIELHRVSLGALVIALGMMVDNAIVVADNYAVRIKRGMKPVDAAIESASQPSTALLGATIVAVLAFYPVFASVTDGGEYGRTLFIVVAIALLLSWLIGVTVTPMNCMALLKPEPAGKSGADGGEDDPYRSGFFRGYRAMLEGAIRLRVLTIGGLTLLLILAIVGFLRVELMFFPNSTRTQFMVDYWGPIGTPVETVSADLKRVEDHLLAGEGVDNIGTFIGSGAPRFYLPVDPELPWESFGQLIVNTETFADVDRLLGELRPWLDEEFPEAMVRLRKYTVGPGDTWPFELRITGPANADRETLRRLGQEGMAILARSPYATDIRTDMRDPVQRLAIDYDQERGRWATVTRDNIAAATKRAYDGEPIGLYRDGDDLIPIIARNVDVERERAAAELDVAQVQPTLAPRSIPLGQVVSNMGLVWEDPILTRWDRHPQIAVQAAPVNGTFMTLQADVAEDIAAIDLPPGYSLSWDGEHKSIVDALVSLVPGIGPAVLITLVIMVALFNAVRPVIVIALALPFAIIGITGALLATNIPFGFMSVLGAMSLVGMLIKNAIVLIDEINLNQSQGASPYDAVVDAGVSRVRPVVLAALTTVLGVAPLLQDVFWVSMAITIMAGLTFGTLITMVLVPTLYATFYRIPSPRRADTAAASTETSSSNA